VPRTAVTELEARRRRLRRARMRIAPRPGCRRAFRRTRVHSRVERSSRLVAAREAQLDAVTGGIVEEQLHLSRERYARRAVVDVQIGEAPLELAPVRASERRVVERAFHARVADVLRIGLAEMQHGPHARVKPITEAPKRRTLADGEAD